MSDTVESARLRLRPQRIDDAEALFEAYGDADLMRYWSSGPHADIAGTRAYLAARTGTGQWRSWAITLPDSDRAIGTVTAGERRPGVIEIGYMLVRSAWGHGYAREAVSALIDRLVRDEGCRRIFADTDPDNDASNALLASLGFQREGLLRAEWETHIGVRDTVLWGLLADEWTARRKTPALSDADHRRHMDSIALPLRRTGLAFALIGLVLAVVRQVWAPGMPVIIPLATLALGALNILGGAALRRSYRRSVAMKNIGKNTGKKAGG